MDAAFLELVRDLRPALHRFCARMVGSVTEAEDVVQDTLARAHDEIDTLREPAALRTWIFRIAHRRAIDVLRARAARGVVVPLDDTDEPAADELPADEAIARAQAIEAALARFARLPPAQRAAVVLKDVLGQSLDDVAATLELSVPAVKAALHRGRSRLAALAGEPEPEPTPPRFSAAVRRYARLFNARDWDGVRALLADDVRLDLVAREQRAGRARVGGYLANYDRATDWYLAPAWLDGREVLAVGRTRDAARASYVIVVDFAADGRVVAIRDFRYVPYVVEEARFAAPWAASAEG